MSEAIKDLVSEVHVDGWLNALLKREQRIALLENQVRNIKKDLLTNLEENTYE